MVGEWFYIDHDGLPSYFLSPVEIFSLENMRSDELTEEWKLSCLNRQGKTDVIS